LCVNRSMNCTAYRGANRRVPRSVKRFPNMARDVNIGFSIGVTVDRIVDDGAVSQ
jgi:hypothetical protein